MKDRFEHVLFLDRSECSRKPSNDYRRWPKPYRLNAEAAIKKQMEKLPKGTKVKKIFSSCDRRTDLSSMPWQLYLEMLVA